MVAKFALMLTVLLGMVALTVDVGRLYVYQRGLQSAADLAALAGARELPGSPTATVNQYLAANGVAGGGEVAVLEDGSLLEVRVGGQVSLTFARVLGYRSSTLRAQAAARLEVTPKWSDLMPWGLMPDPLVVGQEYALKMAAPGPPLAPGNFHIIALNGRRGTSEYLEWIRWGYRESAIEVGAVRPSITGTRAKTEEAVAFRLERAEGYRCELADYDDRCPRVVIVPVVNEYPIGSGNLQIVGFERFFLTEMGGGPSGQLQVKGIYLGPVDTSQIDPADAYRTVRLVR